MVIEPIYQEVDDLESNLTRAQINGKWGYIDRTGKMVIKPTYQYAMKFNSNTGLAEVNVNGKWGYIDRTGKLVVEPIHKYYYTYTVNKRCLNQVPSFCMTTKEIGDDEYVKEIELTLKTGRDI